MEAYSQAKRYVEYAISYMRAISSEHIKVEETSKKLMKHFAGLLKEYLPFEQGLLDRAIAEVKNIVKVAINAIKLEESAKEATHQTATGLETIAGANISRLIASEHEALVLAALANDDLAEYAASYQMFHKLAETVAKENLKAVLETSKEQLVTALEIVEKDLDNVKKEKERRNAELQAAARETEHDSVKLKRDLANKLKVDSHQINLLATASALTGTLKKEELRELVDKSLDENINCIRYALGTNSLQLIEEAFEDAKIDDIYRRYIDKYIFSSKDAEKKSKDHIDWQDSIINATKQIVYNIREYADEALKDEYEEREITDVTAIDYIVLRNVPDEMYKKRDDCLQKIAKGKDLDQLLSCVLLEDPDDDSTITSRHPNGQEVLLEYERARAWQLAEQAQDPSGCGPSQKWISYLTRLHRAILDEAPAFFRT